MVPRGTQLIPAPQFSVEESFWTSTRLTRVHDMKARDLMLEADFGELGAPEPLLGRAKDEYLELPVKTCRNAARQNGCEELPS